ncbi:MAG TPA: chorismate-binding protein, partial [Opitutales bacterium]|nr:chorismate-binding protein [Opitutales bacterium]
YGGLTGWFNAKGEGDFVVNIRCAVVSGKLVWIRAGAGIVEGSDPDREWNETALKLDSMLSSLVSEDEFQGAAGVVSGVDVLPVNADEKAGPDGSGL